MLAKVPFKFFTGKFLSLYKMITNFQELSKYINDNHLKKYTYSDFTVDWSGFTESTTKEIKVALPYNAELISCEISLEEPTGVVSSVEVRADSTSLVTIEPQGAATLAKDASNVHFPITANNAFNLTLVVTASGAYTLDRCYVTFYFRTARGVTTSYTLDKIPTISSGDNVDDAIIDAEFTEIAAAVANDTAQQTDARFEYYQFVSIPNPQPAHQIDFRIPGSGKFFDSIYCGVYCDVGTSVTVSIIDSLGGTVGSVTLPGAGVTTISTGQVATLNSQNNDPSDTGEDYFIRFTRTGTGVIRQAYAIVTYR
jgi:hypothetical protein